MRHLTAFTIFALLSAGLVFGQDTPAPRAKPGFSALRYTQLKPCAFVYTTVRGAVDEKLGTAIRDRIDAVRTGINSAEVPPIAGPVFVYHGSDPGKEMIVDIGFPVADNTPAIPGMEVGRLESGLAATSIYTGPTTGMNLGHLYSEIEAAGHVPSGVMRVRNLYYEDDKSQNNIVMIEILLQK